MNIREANHVSARHVVLHSMVHLVLCKLHDLVISRRIRYMDTNQRQLR